MKQVGKDFLQPPTPGSWVYLMTSSTGHGRTKIGMTKRNPILRFATLRCGDPFLCLHAAFYLPSSCSLQAFELERRLHTFYSHCRIEFLDGGLSEWFQVNCDYAERQCQDFIENQFVDEPRHIRSFTSDAYFEGVHILKAYESDLTSFFGPPPVVDENGIPFW